MGTMINLLFLVDGLNPGGAERQLFYLINNLDERKYNVTLVTWYPSSFFLELKAKMNLQWIEVIRAGRFDLSPIKTILSVVQKNKVDIIHAYLDTACLYGAIAKLLNRRIKFIATERNAFKKLNFFQKIHKPIAHRIADITITNSDRAISFLLSLGVRKEKILFLRNGIDALKIEKESQLEVSSTLSEKKVLLCIGRITTHKNQLGLVQAFNKSRIKFGFSLVLVGNSNEEYKKQIEDYIIENDLTDSVVFYDATKDVHKYFTISSVVVLFSDYEGTPNVVMEAMASSRPVVATNVGDVQDYINESNGWVIPPGDQKALLSVLDKISDMNDDALVKMGLSGRQKIHAMGCTIENMVANHEKVYQELLRSE